MATTISCSSAGIGIGSNRCSINNLYFIEVGSSGIGIGSNPCKIKSGVGASIIIVDSWDPADNSYQHEHLAPFRVDCHANSGTNEFTILYDDSTDWDSGTYNDTTQIGQGIELAVNSPFVDFQDYTNNTLVVSGVQPDSWTDLSGVYAAYIRDDLVTGQQTIRSEASNNTDMISWDAGGSDVEAAIQTAKFRFNGSGHLGFIFNCTGAGAALRGYSFRLVTGSSYASFRRQTSATSATTVNSPSIGFTIAQNTWYWLKVSSYRQDGGTGNVACQFKCWQDGNSEPESYTWGGSDGVYKQNGRCGIVCYNPTALIYGYADDYSFDPQPSQYFSSGDWESGEIDTTSIGLYSYAVISWDETAPTNTTASVKARWDARGSWLSCTNGGEVPGIGAGQLMATGSATDSLELRVELATTEPTSTPSVSNLQLYHEPAANAAFKIEIDSGTIDCIESDGSLEIWGKSQISGGSIITDWDAITLETIQPYRLLDQNDSISVGLYYNDVLIDDIAVQLKPDYWMVSGNNLGWQFSMDPVKYASAPVEARWNCQEPWAPMGHGYEWVLIDYTMGMRADASFLVGHYQLDSHPGSFILGLQVLDPHPGSYLLKGNQLDPHPGSFLVQGDRLDSHPGSFLVSLEEYSSHPGSFLIGTTTLNSHPGSFLVYGVNRDGSIFMNIVDDATYAKLVAEGIIFS